MLNELPYIELSRAARRWIAAGLLFAIRERFIYALEKATMNIGIFKTALILVALAASATAGIYAIQKPYQQERIKFAVHRLLGDRQT